VSGRGGGGVERPAPAVPTQGQGQLPERNPARQVLRSVAGAPAAGIAGRGADLCREVVEVRLLAPACCLHGRSRMEHSWSRAVATSGNRWQTGRPRERLEQAKTVAMGCDRLPIGAHGKEGVDGSSPSEGFGNVPQRTHIRRGREHQLIGGWYSGRDAPLAEVGCQRGEKPHRARCPGLGVLDLAERDGLIHEDRVLPDVVPAKRERLRWAQPGVGESRRGSRLRPLLRRVDDV
jgi:hypothetical protein